MVRWLLLEKAHLGRRVHKVSLAFLDLMDFRGLLEFLGMMGRRDRLEQLRLCPDRRDRPD